MVDQVVNFDALPDLPTDPGTMVESHPPLALDKEDQNPTFPTPTPLQVNETHPFSDQQGLNGLSQSCNGGITLYQWRSPQRSHVQLWTHPTEKKMGASPISASRSPVQWQVC
jgi:hypothetical protein